MCIILQTSEKNDAVIYGNESELKKRLRSDCAKHFKINFQSDIVIYPDSS